MARNLIRKCIMGSYPPFQVPSIVCAAVGVLNQAAGIWGFESAFYKDRRCTKIWLYCRSVFNPRRGWVLWIHGYGQAPPLLYRLRRRSGSVQELPSQVVLSGHRSSLELCHLQQNLSSPDNGWQLAVPHLISSSEGNRLKEQRAGPKGTE